jgi:opacity protein-like surface antigen
MMSCFKKMQLALLLWLPQAAFCGMMGASYNPYDGLYVGLDVGIANTHNVAATNFPSSSLDLASTGIVGGGLIGYDFSVLERFKIGVEFLVNATGINASSRRYFDNISFTTQERYYLAPRVLPGFLFYDKVVGHLILGYTNANITIKDNGTYGFLNKSSSLSGFQAGLGMKVDLIQNFTLRADAVYSIYQTLSANGATNNVLYSYQKYTNNLSTLEGNLILIYKFINL